MRKSRHTQCWSMRPCTLLNTILMKCMAKWNKTCVTLCCKLLINSLIGTWITKRKTWSHSHHQSSVINEYTRTTITVAIVVEVVDITMATVFSLSQWLFASSGSIRHQRIWHHTANTHIWKSKQIKQMRYGNFMQIIFDEMVAIVNSLATLTITSTSLSLSRRVRFYFLLLCALAWAKFNNTMCYLVILCVATSVLRQPRYNNTLLVTKWFCHRVAVRLCGPPRHTMTDNLFQFTNSRVHLFCNLLCARVRSLALSVSISGRQDRITILCGVRCLWHFSDSSKRSRHLC